MINQSTRSTRTDGGQPRSKVARIIEERDLDGLGEELEQRWLATDDSGMSLRQLAEYFNKQVVEAAIGESEMTLLDTDIDTIYAQLTADDVSSGTRTRTERRLDRNGIDIGDLRADFVTHQAMHTYLREYRSVSQPEATPEERQTTAVERIQKLQDRTAAVTEDTIESLQRDDIVPEGETDVLVNISVVYTETGEQYNVFDLLEE